MGMQYTYLAVFFQIIENELAETYHELWDRLLELISTAVKG